MRTSPVKNAPAFVAKPTDRSPQERRTENLPFHQRQDIREVEQHAREAFHVDRFGRGR